MTMKVILLMSLALLFAGCGSPSEPGTALFDGQGISKRLCGDYRIIKTSSHQVQISPTSWDDRIPIIPAKVVAFGHDNRFIIAQQNHLKRRSPGDPRDTYMELDPGVYSYWILDVSIPKVFGPLTESEFRDKRNELGVPNELSLQNVHNYRE